MSLRASAPEVSGGLHREPTYLVTKLELGNQINNCGWHTRTYPNHIGVDVVTEHRSVTPVTHRSVIIHRVKAFPRRQEPLPDDFSKGSCLRRINNGRLYGY